MPGTRLTVVLAGPSAVAPDWAEVVDLHALASDDVRTILGTYLDRPAADAALPQVLRQPQRG
jgi:hypothetical protein